MRVLLVALLVCACGRSTPAPVQPPPVANTEQVAAPAPAIEPVETIATTLGRAGLGGDRATAMSLTLTFEQLATFSSKATERPHAREDWDGEVKDFFDRLEREGSEHTTVNVVSATIVRQGTLKASAGERILRDTDYAFVQLVIQQDGGEATAKGPPLLFVRTEMGWRFSPKR